MNDSLANTDRQAVPPMVAWNGPFNQSHLTLFKSLRQLKELIHLHEEGQRAALIDQLIHMRNVLAEHFAVEQGPQYLAGVLEQNPELEHKVHELRGEHVALSEELDQLIEDGLVGRCPIEELRKRSLEWLSLIRFHESRENRLLQDAVCLDVGAED
jgi:hypothetical protein